MNFRIVVKNPVQKSQCVFLKQVINVIGSCIDTAVNLQMNRTLKYQGTFFRIVGLGRKSFLFTPSTPPSPIFWLLLQLSRNDSIGNACYAG